MFWSKAHCNASGIYSLCEYFFWVLSPAIPTPASVRRSEHFALRHRSTLPRLKPGLVNVLRRREGKRRFLFLSETSVHSKPTYTDIQKGQKGKKKKSLRKSAGRLFSYSGISSFAKDLVALYQGEISPSLEPQVS